MRGRVNVGTKWLIKTPSVGLLMSKDSKHWNGVEVKIIGKGQYRKFYPGPIIPFDKVAVRILSAPEDSLYRDKIGEWHILDKGWLCTISGSDNQNNLCTCTTSFLISGCKCGGV